MFQSRRLVSSLLLLPENTVDADDDQATDDADVEKIDVGGAQGSVLRRTREENEELSEG